MGIAGAGVRPRPPRDQHGGAFWGEPPRPHEPRPTGRGRGSRISPARGDPQGPPGQELRGRGEKHRWAGRLSGPGRLPPSPSDQPTSSSRIITGGPWTRTASLGPPAGHPALTTRLGRSAPPAQNGPWESLQATRGDPSTADRDANPREDTPPPAGPAPGLSPADHRPPPPRTSPKPRPANATLPGRTPATPTPDGGATPNPAHPAACAADAKIR